MGIMLDPKYSLCDATSFKDCIPNVFYRLPSIPLHVIDDKRKKMKRKIHRQRSLSLLKKHNTWHKKDNENRIVVLLMMRRNNKMVVVERSILKQRQRTKKTNLHWMSELSHSVTPLFTIFLFRPSSYFPFMVVFFFLSLRRKPLLFFSLFLLCFFCFKHKSIYAYRLWAWFENNERINYANSCKVEWR